MVCPIPGKLKAVSRAAAIVMWVVTLLLAVSGADAAQAPVKGPRTETGLASYYARSLQGKETASGEEHDNRDMVAAHPKYPLGTRVRVTNLENGKSAVVRITDRGATAPNRREGVI